MPRGGAEHTLARREEIITACEQLYLERDFHDVTIKDIGARTSFTRTSIYNYFDLPRPAAPGVSRVGGGSRGARRDRLRRRRGPRGGARGDARPERDDAAPDEHEPL